MRDLILELLANALDIVCLTMLFTKRLQPKFNSILPTALFAICAFVLESIPQMLTVNFYPTEIIVFCVCVSYVVLFRKGKILHKLFWVIVAFILIFAIAFAVMPIIAYVSGFDMVTILHHYSFSVRTLFLAIVNIIKFTVFYAFTFRIQKDHFSTRSSFICVVNAMICIVSGSWITRILSVNVENTLNENIVLIFAVSYFLISIVSVIMYEITQKEAAKTMCLLAKESQYEVLSQYTEFIKKTKDEVRLWQHDLNGHMSCVSVLLENKDFEGAKRYIEKLTDSIAVSFMKISSGNYLVDAIISPRIEKALTEGIKFECNASLPEIIPMNDVDLCSILSNILDNAMEACERRKEGAYVKCSIETIKNQLIIDVENSSDGRYFVKGGVFVSRKIGGIHGVGLQSIKSTVDKYEGICTVTPSDNRFRIEISIPFN